MSGANYYYFCSQLPTLIPGVPAPMTLEEFDRKLTFLPDADAGYILKNLPNLFGGRLAKLFETKPDINLKKCVGCGICASSCPRHTIRIESKKSKKYAKIDRSDCIRCFCCQELCPIGAVDIKQNFLIKLIH